MTLTSAYASETGYEVELIIFEDTKSRYFGSEDWSYNDIKHLTVLENKENNSNNIGKIQDSEYTQLEWTTAKLAEKMEKINKNPDFRILINKRWKQTGLSRENAFKIPISSKIKSARMNKIGDSLKLDSNSYITGSVSLIMSRYLHFNLDLEYYKSVTSETKEIDATQKMYPILAERRMRSREIHYIDHPLVGIIVVATPYSLTEDKPKAATTEYKTL